MIIPGKKATRELTKIHNSRLVFTTIYQHKHISRAQIVRATDLTATTVSNVVAGLIGVGLVEEGAAVPAARGKPPTLLRIAKDAQHLICLDLARSAFQGAIVNLRGEILHQAHISLEGRTGEAALNAAYDLVDGLLNAASRPPLGIGVGAPGIIDPDKGIVLRAVNFGWYDLPLRDRLRQRYQLPVHLVNASHAAVLAEYTFGRRKGTPDLVVVKVGHDVGSGIILNGQLFLGHGFGAGEIGHVKVVDDGERCMCGNFGCLETVVSSRAIVRRAQAITRANPALVADRGASILDEPEIGALWKALRAEEKLLQDIISEVGHHLGVAIAYLVGVLSVPYVLIAGRVAELGEPLLDVINREVRSRSLARTVSRTRVELASLGAEIVLLGAGALLLHHELGVV